MMTRASLPPATPVPSLPDVLVQHYNAALKLAIYASQFKGTLTPYREMTPTYQGFFKRAAETCKRLGAQPADYVKAQFEAFAKYSRGKKRPILPMPAQLYGTGAEIRYMEYMSGRVKVKLATTRPTQVKASFVEQRKLNGMCSMYQQPESDVLAEHPEEFSQSFLEAKGVWETVEELWSERRR